MYGHACFLASIPLARLGKERPYMRTVNLDPGAVRREIDVWLARSSKSETDRYRGGTRGIRLSDGRLVRCTAERGVLAIDGKLEYSAAWL